jgi:hypothetical protein
MRGVDIKNLVIYRPINYSGDCLKVYERSARAATHEKFMKLHTDFHDYYDTAVGFGIDDKVHYNRFTQTIEKSLNLKRDFPPLNSFYFGKTLILGFCGEIFPMIGVIEWNEETHKPKFIYYTYSYDEYFARMLKTERALKLIDHELGRQRRPKNEKEIRKQLTKDLTKKKVKEFFSDWRWRDDDLFLEHRAPVWLINLDSNDQKITLNPKLSELDFERIKDANQAFQEISMYLANILVEQKETAPIEDKYRIEQHGFDLKTSFRKEKR